MLLVGARRDRRVLSFALGDALTVGPATTDGRSTPAATAASAAKIHQKYAPTKPTKSTTPTNWASSSSDAKPIPALHAQDAFTGVMQRMSLKRVVRVGGMDVAHIEPLAEPALDDVDVVHPTCPPVMLTNRARA